MKNSLRPLEQLDLSIPNMDTGMAESAVSGLLSRLPGVNNVRLIERGAWIEYDSSGISAPHIVSMLHRAGFRAGMFQDSKSGHMGSSNV